MAATETIKPSMPETVEAAELVRRNRQGELAHCLIEGPLSFDLAYAADAGAKKRIEGSVVGAADIMLFPNLLSANLTVKAIMYTADCKFGGVLRGTSAPVVFMSRADTTETRLNSLALTLRILDHQAECQTARQLKPRIRKNGGTDNNVRAMGVGSGRSEFGSEFMGDCG